MLICHNCGTPLENKVRQCHHCQGLVSTYSAVKVAEAVLGSPLKIEFGSEPGIFNSLIAKELIKVTSSNGHIGSGNGSSSSRSNGKSDGNGNEPSNNYSGDPKVEKNESISTDHNATVSETLNRKENANANFFLSLSTQTRETDKILPSTNNTDQISPNTASEAPKPDIKPVDFFAEMLNTTNDTWEEKESKFNFEQLNSPAPAQDSISQIPSQNPFTQNSFNQVSSSEKSLFPPELDNKTNSTPWTTPNLEETEIAEKTDLHTNILSQIPEAEIKPELQEEATDIKNIHRRSFSGDFSGVSSNKSQIDLPDSKNSNFASLLRKFKTPFSGVSSSKILKNKDKLLGLKPWQLGVGAVIVIFLLFKGFEAFCGIGTALFNNSANSPTGQSVSISGRWQFAAKWNNRGCNGQLILHQNGNQIFGQGIDSQYGTYKFNGTTTGNHLDFLKQYYVGNAFTGHPIELHGDIDISNKPLFISGNFSQEYMEGGKWRGKPVVLTGMWEAEMIQPIIEDGNTANFVPLIKKHDERPAAAYGGLFGSLSKFGTWVAIGIISGGCFLYYLARALIGPDGWLGIWDKQKYVPAQFMKEHKREKALLSKPITKGSLPLGQRWEWKFWQEPFFWIPRYLAIPPEIRVNSPHVLILGGGEKGKSRLMARMITHDIESADRAVVLVDSDGDLADLLLRWISAHPNGQELAQRTIVIDPTNNQPSPSFNPLESPDDNDLQNAASSIVHGFKAIYHEPPGSQNQWSPQTAHILRNCAMLLMANNKTLLDLPTLLQDNDFRDILLEKIEQKRKDKVEYATLLETWGQYKRLARTEQWINWYEPILNRVGPTLINQRLRPILTQPQGDINLKQIIADKKILIVKIPKGQLHEDANLLGALIVTGLKQAAIALCTDGKNTERTAAMYLDEFDHFIEKETLDAITTETKKFQLGFIGATKTLQHLPEDWRNQIEANIGTMCVFALTKKDGDMLGPRMFRVSGRKAKHRTLMNIFNPINTSPQFELISDEEKYNIDRVLAQSERQFYAFRVGAEAGIFRMSCLDFNDIPDEKVDANLLQLMYKNR